MAKLNQIIAIEKGIKSGVYSELTEINKAVQKPELFNGFAKTYRKLDDNATDLPAEGKRVSFTARGVLEVVERRLTTLFTVTARKDWTNCVAKGTVKIDDTTIVADAPVSYLLFLEKQMNDIKTIITNMPVLDIAEDWEEDPNSGLHKTAPITTHRTAKVQKPLVLYPATDKHPAQTQMITEDVIAGYWDQVKHSGAIPRTRKAELLERVEKLIEAIKQAREQANMADEVVPPAVGTAVFNFLLGPQVAG